MRTRTQAPGPGCLNWMENTFICQVGGEKTSVSGPPGPRGWGWRCLSSFSHEVGLGGLSPFSTLQNPLQNTLHPVTCSNDIASANTAVATPFPADHPRDLPHLTGLSEIPPLAWPRSPALALPGMCALWGRLRILDLWRPMAATSQVLSWHRSGGPHSWMRPPIPPAVGSGQPLTFGVRYLVITSFPFSPSFSSGVTSYSA